MNKKPLQRHILKKKIPKEVQDKEIALEETLPENYEISINYVHNGGKYD